MAAASLANIVKSSLGPLGLDKMLVDDIGVNFEELKRERDKILIITFKGCYNYKRRCHYFEITGSRTSSC